MLNILKDTQFFTSGQLPVSLYYKGEKEDSGSLGFHAHEFTEIAVVFRGTAVYETDFSKDVIREGDVLIVPQGGLHRYDEEVDVELINILFHFDRLPVPTYHIARHPGYVALFGIDPDYYRRREYYPKLHLPPEQLAGLRSILFSAYRMQQARSPGATLAVYGAFLQTIPILLEHFEPGETLRNPPMPEMFRQTLNYMLDNYRHDLCIAKLAKKAGMSHSTFTRTFKKALGVTPLQYLTAHRLATAQELLRNGYSVSEAAAESGFNDCNYFTRMFHKYMHSLPKSWKS